MNILIIGLGVIGGTYGWQLAKNSGNQITHYIRNEKNILYRENGISIKCLDMRKSKGEEISEVYKPNVIIDIAGITNDEYDLVIVPVKVNQVDNIIELLKCVNKDIPVLFLQNLWITQINTIEKVFVGRTIIFGQPHLIGGGIIKNEIICTIFNNKNAPTMLGSHNNKKNAIMMELSDTLSRSQLNPQIVNNIVPWLITHYVESAGLIAGVMKAKNEKKYVETTKYINDSVLLTREGYKVCSKYGINSYFVYPQCLYWAPLPLIASALQKMFSSKESQLMIQGHIMHSPDEMKYMFGEVLKAGILKNVKMTKYLEYASFVEAY